MTETSKNVSVMFIQLELCAKYNLKHWLKEHDNSLKERPHDKALNFFKQVIYVLNNL